MNAAEARLRDFQRRENSAQKKNGRKKEGKKERRKEGKKERRKEGATLDTIQRRPA